MSEFCLLSGISAYMKSWLPNWVYMSVWDKIFRTDMVVLLHALSTFLPFNPFQNNETLIYFKILTFKIGGAFECSSWSLMMRFLFLAGKSLFNSSSRVSHTAIFLLKIIKYMLIFNYWLVFFMNIHNKFKFVWSQLNILLYKKHASMDLLYFLIECRYTNYGTFGTYAFQSKMHLFVKYFFVYKTLLKAKSFIYEIYVYHVNFVIMKTNAYSNWYLAIQAEEWRLRDYLFRFC